MIFLHKYVDKNKKKHTYSLLNTSHGGTEGKSRFKSEYFYIAA